MKGKIYTIEDALADADIINEWLVQAKAPQHVGERMDHIRGMIVRLGAMARHLHASVDERKTAETQARLAIDGK
jgi:C4-dicarboxylate-specific signal transduction histidine kinase